MIREVTFHWDDKHGDCFDCGRPAAYTSSEYDSSPMNLRCAVCAAYDVAELGATIVFLNSEKEESAA